MAFPKARNKRFNEVLSCAPPPGYYNPKMDNSKLPGAYIEKTERFKPLVKDSPSKSLSSNPSTSKNCSGHQDALLQECKRTVGRRFLVWDSRAKELVRIIAEKEQELFEIKAILAHVTEKRESYVHEEHSRIKQLKRCTDDSDSDATLSADEVTTEDNFELEFLRCRLSEAKADFTKEKIENVSLTKKLNETEELLQQERRKSKKFQNRLRRTTVESKKAIATKTRECRVLAPSFSISDDVFQPETLLQDKCVSLDSRIQLLNRCDGWLRSIKDEKKSNDAFWCDIGPILQSFPHPRESKSLTCSMDIYDEMTNIKNSICCKLEDYLTNGSQVLDMCKNLMKLYSHEVEQLQQYKSAAGEHIAQVEVSIENSLNFYESFSCEQVEAYHKMREVARHSTNDSIEALNELQECKKEIESMTNALETERKSNLSMLQDNKRLSDENQKLVKTTIELREETSALNSRVSEMSGTLTRNNEQINELNSENERQSLEISALYNTISTLESNIQRVSAEKEAILLHCHSKCAPLKNEAEDLRACYSAECNKNAVLSKDLTASKTKVCEMEEEVINLHKYIDQLKLDNQNLYSEFGSQLKRTKNLMHDELNKLMEENRSQEQLYRQQIMVLENKCVESSSEVREQLKKCEDEKENWKTLYENLEAKIAPFKDQLDAYEAEKILLLNQNDEKQHQLERLSETYARLLGHQNHKQKIKHVEKIKDENLSLKKEIKNLQEEILKQASIIRKLKFGEPRLDPKDPKLQDVLKENRSISSRP